MKILDFLGDNEKRSALVDLLLSTVSLSPQQDLFGESEYKRDLKKILDEISSSVSDRKPLYRRWSDEIEGKRRNLSVPQKPLAKLVGGYLLPLIKTKEVHHACHGSERTWNPELSLRCHLPISGVLSFDLKNANESFPPRDIYDFFINLMQEYTERDYMARFLTLLCTVKYEHGRGLPIGAQFSTILFNRVLFSLDEKLAHGAEKRGMRYSRWVDDMTINSQEQRDIREFLGAIEVTDQKYIVSPKKVFFQTNDYDIYLLGHRISPNGKIFKNSPEEREKNKVKPIDFENARIQRNYEPWI